MKLRLNLIKVGNAGLDHQYVCHMFVDDKFLNSMSLSISYSDSRVEDSMQKMAEEHILEVITKGTGYSYDLTVNESGTYKDSILEYDISLNTPKTPYQLIKQKFIDEGRGGWGSWQYFGRRSIYDIQPKFIKSSCVEIGGSYIHEPEFNNIMKEQGAALVDFMAEKFGVKITITHFPGYRERDSGGFGADIVRFGYTIDKVIDKSKLQVEVKEVDLLSRLNELIFKCNSFNGEKKEQDIFKAKKPEDCIESLDGGLGLMTRNPYEFTTLDEAIKNIDNNTMMWFVKQRETQVKKDLKKYKDKIFSLFLHSHHTQSTARTLTNLKKLMPWLYEEVYGELTPGLVACLYYENYMKYDNKLSGKELKEQMKIPQMK